MSLVALPTVALSWSGNHSDTDEALTTDGAERTPADMTESQSVDWLEWGPEAFDRARHEDKPILLDIGATWCHWCHVMERTTYSDADVVRLITEHYVPIYVDTDRRPDINQRYNQGGWPTTALLAPTGELLTGFTYVPPDAMIEVLRQVNEQWQRDRERIRERIAQSCTERDVAARRPRPAKRVSGSAAGNVLRSLSAAFDREYGGWGRQPKFPNPEAVQLLLDRAAVAGDDAALAMARKTLDGMRGLYDDVTGGFFRYAVNRDWTEPHYEKMGEGNAGAIRNYLQLYQATGEGQYLDLARGALRYVGERLRDPEEGCFYGSQDADVGSHDPDVEYVPGERYHQLDAEGRARYREPYVDKTLYADINALLVGACLHAHAVTAEDAYRRIARQAMERSLTYLLDERGGLYHYRTRDGERGGYGFLNDHALMASALLDAYELSGHPTDLQRAQQLVAFADQQLWDEEAKAYCDTPSRSDHESHGALAVRLRPMEQNARLAQALIRLAHLTARDEHRQRAQQALEASASEYERHSILAAAYAIASERLLNEPLRVVVVSGPGDAKAERMAREASRSYHPWKIVQRLETPRDRALIQALSFDPDHADAVAFVCVGQRCLRATDPRALKRALEE